MSADRIARFTTLVEQQPDNVMFRFSLAQALEAGEDPTLAIPHYQTCAAAKADWMMPRILLGKLLLKQGDITAARPVLENALQLAIAQDHEDPAMELQAILEDLPKAP
ncbi:tetratricopeptide repeat protein [Actomonas aquatica]|uniref:Tetratricopeptide repeat protein n=1 Tax=Actomonas aquatica TaxID=2866162 RepID=A0ABZ1CDI9_9BACT|nr:tetratricopeptide repeat protein [Opitutus sp. WL0086]WRQ88365.1 tetratricopeptide repeat protein [Opitutus sp. WL0086]